MYNFIAALTFETYEEGVEIYLVGTRRDRSRGYGSLFNLMKDVIGSMLESDMTKVKELNMVERISRRNEVIFRFMIENGLDNVKEKERKYSLDKMNQL